ncbi:MAG: cyclodeaminase/cyclohydrolase family protein [Clostridiales bacterium]|nr:cyclodeaminase/cyclohydrolase family protein [Clostridiales bacterium]
MLAKMKLNDFLEKTASNKPVPGGGSVAAMTAAAAAALVEMVANLTIGKKKYIEVEAEMKNIAKTARELREKFVVAIDKDANAFNGVMNAFKMPKDTEEQGELRKIQIQKNMKKASLVPLEVAEDAFSMMEMITGITEKGNKNAVTDAAVATMMARTAVLSALYNVKINLSTIKDEDFVKKISLKISELETKIVDEEKSILSKVEF